MYKARDHRQMTAMETTPIRECVVQLEKEKHINLKATMKESKLRWKMWLDIHQYIIWMKTYDHISKAYGMLNRMARVSNLHVSKLCSNFPIVPQIHSLVK